MLANVAVAVVRDVAELWLVGCALLVVAGDGWAAAPRDAALFAGVFVAAHLAGRAAAGDDCESGASPTASVLDLQRVQYAEVYAAFIGAFAGSIFAVLDWRDAWQEFPWLSLALAVFCAASTHVVRRLALARSKRDRRE
jgi:hypothetical protein